MAATIGHPSWREASRPCLTQSQGPPCGPSARCREHDICSGRSVVHHAIRLALSDVGLVRAAAGRHVTRVANRTGIVADIADKPGRSTHPFGGSVAASISARMQVWLTGRRHGLCGRLHSVHRRDGHCRRRSACGDRFQPDRCPDPIAGLKCRPAQAPQHESLADDQPSASRSQSRRTRPVVASLGQRRFGARQELCILPSRRTPDDGPRLHRDRRTACR